MKRTAKQARTAGKRAGELQPEYKFDYEKAKPNRFAGQRPRDQVVVILDPDVARVFSTPESVNAALRAVLSAIPQQR